MKEWKEKWWYEERSERIGEDAEWKQKWQNEMRNERTAKTTVRMEWMELKDGKRNEGMKKNSIMKRAMKE